MKSYTLRPDTFTLNFNVTLSGTSRLGRGRLSVSWAATSQRSTRGIPSCVSPLCCVPHQRRCLLGCRRIASPVKTWASPVCIRARRASPQAGTAPRCARRTPAATRKQPRIEGRRSRAPRKGRAPYPPPSQGPGTTVPTTAARLHQPSAHSPASCHMSQSQEGGAPVSAAWEAWAASNPPSTRATP
jgi:hypothetical protein